MTSAPLSMIVAMANGGVIGKGGKLPWRIPEDLKHFRRLTTGHAVIMGRKTYEEVGKPLPNRRNIVVTRQPNLSLGGCEVTGSVEEAVAMARAGGDSEPFIIGGAEIYLAALPRVTRIYLTEVHREVDGDTRFELDRTGFHETERRAGEEPDVVFITLERSPVGASA